MILHFINITPTVVVCYQSISSTAAGSDAADPGSNLQPGYTLANSCFESYIRCNTTLVLCVCTQALVTGETNNLGKSSFHVSLKTESR